MIDNDIKAFDSKRIRTVWDEEKQEMLFSVIDVVAVLTESTDTKQYIKKMRSRDPELDSKWGTICTPVAMIAPDGKTRLTTAANAEGVLQILENISTPKKESFKLWLESIEKEMKLPSIYNKGEIVLYRPDNSITMEVLLENETVWLSLNQIATLFNRDKSVIQRHIKNIFAEEELFRNRSVAFFATHLQDGRVFEIEYFNLDVIISVGYRVKSKQGVQFRQWANSVLKEYILRGYVVNQRVERLEHRVFETEKKIEYFINLSLPPVQGILNEGQIFDAHVFVSDLMLSAKRSIVLLDNYADHSVLLLLSKRCLGVSAEIYTRRITPNFRTDIEKHNEQYEEIRVHESDRFHDRFLIIDDDVYHIGSSLKDLGKKLFAFSLMEETREEMMKRLQ